MAHRIDSATKEVDAHGSGKHGFGEFPTATQLTEAWFDSVQEEHIAPIEDEGVALDKTDQHQLLKALKLRRQRNALRNWQVIDTTVDPKHNALASSPHADGTTRWVAVGQQDGGAALWRYSAGGSRWSAPVGGMPASTEMAAVASDGAGLFVAVGAGGKILTGPYNLPVAQTSGVAVNLSSVCWAGALNLWVAVGSSGTILKSPDGETWTTVSTGGSEVFSSVAFGLETPAGTPLLLAIHSGDTVLKSANATAWTLDAASPSGAANLRAIIWDPSTGTDFLALDFNDGVKRRRNGTWSSLVLPEPAPGGSEEYRFLCVDAVTKAVVVVGDEYAAARDSQGVWTWLPVPAHNLRAIHSDGTVWIAGTNDDPDDRRLLRSLYW